jgi:hypothetical protein
MLKALKAFLRQYLVEEEGFWIIHEWFSEDQVEQLKRMK